MNAGSQLANRKDSIKAILFDLDGTLMETAKGARGGTLA